MAFLALGRLRVRIVMRPVWDAGMERMLMRGGAVEYSRRGARRRWRSARIVVEEWGGVRGGELEERVVVGCWAEGKRGHRVEMGTTFIIMDIYVF